MSTKLHVITDDKGNQFNLLAVIFFIMSFQFSMLFTITKIFFCETCPVLCFNVVPLSFGHDN